MNEILMTLAIAFTGILVGYWIKREQHKNEREELLDVVANFRTEKPNGRRSDHWPPDEPLTSTHLHAAVDKPVDKPVPQSSVQVADDVLEYALAYLYNFGAIAVAQLCDELDRSGVLLGRVRDRAFFLRENEVDDAPSLPNKPIRREFQQFLGCPVCGHPLNVPCDHDEDPVELLRTVSVSRPD